MDEHVARAILRCDEAKTLCCVEPLDGTDWHSAVSPVRSHTQSEKSPARSHMSRLPSRYEDVTRCADVPRARLRRPLEMGIGDGPFERADEALGRAVAGGDRRRSEEQNQAAVGLGDDNRGITVGQLTNAV